jgi:hypothetical protein
VAILFLKYALELRKSLEEDRRELDELAKSKCIYDPEVKKSLRIK